MPFATSQNTPHRNWDFSNIVAAANSAKTWSWRRRSQTLTFKGEDESKEVTDDGKEIGERGGSTSASYLAVEFHELYLTDSEIVFTLCEDNKSVATVRARASDDEGP